MDAQQSTKRLPILVWSPKKESVPASPATCFETGMTLHMFGLLLFTITPARGARFVARDVCVFQNVIFR